MYHYVFGISKQKDHNSAVKDDEELQEDSYSFPTERFNEEILNLPGAVRLEGAETGEGAVP